MYVEYSLSPVVSHNFSFSSQFEHTFRILHFSLSFLHLSIVVHSQPVIWLKLQSCTCMHVYKNHQGRSINFPSSQDGKGKGYIWEVGLNDRKLYSLPPPSHTHIHPCPYTHTLYQEYNREGGSVSYFTMVLCYNLH